MSEEMNAKIQQALDRIRPALQMDGGDIHFVEWHPEEKRVRVALDGACVGCSMASMTMVLGVERVIKQMVPEVEIVEAI